MRSVITLFLTTLGISALLGASCQPQQSFFHGLGDLPGGGIWSEAWDVSDDGRTVVGRSHSANGYEIFLWQPLGMEALALNGWRNPRISADGVSVAGSQAHPVFGSEVPVLEEGGTLVFPSGTQAEIGGRVATNVSRDGRFVTVTNVNTVPGAWLWDTEVMVGNSFTDLTGANGPGPGLVSDLSADGSVIVGWTRDGNNRRGTVWDPTGAYSFLPDLPGGVGSEPIAISADGRTIVGYSTMIHPTGPRLPVRWLDGNIEHLGSLAGFHSSGTAVAHGVSADGSVIVGEVANIAGGYQAFIWFEGSGMFDLRTYLLDDERIQGVQDWTLLRAVSVSGNGKIVVGWGYNPDGQFEAWRARVLRP